jgi:hypothetical protein
VAAQPVASPVVLRSIESVILCLRRDFRKNSGLTGNLATDCATDVYFT